MLLASKRFSIRRHTHFRDFSPLFLIRLQMKGLLCLCVTMVTSYPVHAGFERPPLVKYAVNSCTIVHLHSCSLIGVAAVPCHSAERSESKLFCPRNID